LRIRTAIVVDDTMRPLGCANLHAIGECSEHRGVVHGLLAPAWEQAAVVADRITGADPHAEYRGSRPATKLKVSGVELATMGIVEPDRPSDEVIRYAEPKRRIYKTAIVRDGRLAGAILLGDLDRMPFLTQALDNGSVLPRERASLLFDLGRPRDEDLTADAQVCNCNGVSKADIDACVTAGKRTLQEIATATRAGTGCGSCKPRVLRIVESAA
jgi:nitrite reductase (NADH) large subunit